MKRILFVFLTVVFFTLSFSFTNNQSKYFGFSLNNPIEISGLQPPELVDNILVFYSSERNIDPIHYSPVSYGFSFYSNLGLNDYDVHGLAFNFNVKVFGLTIFNKGEKLQLGFQGDVLYKREAFKKKVGTSSNIQDFGTSSFLHYNKIVVDSISIRPGIRGDLVFNSNIYLSGRMYYNIQFFIGSKTETGDEVVVDVDSVINSIDVELAINIPF